MKQIFIKLILILAPMVSLTACYKFLGHGHGHGPGGPSSSDTTKLYVAVNGNDNNTGASGSPLATLTKAIQKWEPGDTILVRAGTYYPTGTILIDKSGTSSSPILIKAETADFPVFDFSKAVSQGDAGIQIEASWLHLKGLHITRARDKGVYLTGETAAHNTLEQLTLRQINGVGLAIYVGASNNVVLNCDAFANYDSAHHGQNADGFKANYSVGLGNRFVGCRAWNNSDDGYDLWEAGNAVTFENCYTWANGVNIWNDPLFDGNGNGFKLGQGGGAHVLVNCAAWNMAKSGFDLNGNSGGVKIDNCTAVLCGKFNFDIFWGVNESTDSADYVNNVLRNNLSAGGGNRIRVGVKEVTNSWNIPLDITADDFKSIDPSSLEGPRGPDGSLPTGSFLQLASSSLAIDAGTNIGKPYNGAAPDLGAFESGN